MCVYIYIFLSYFYWVLLKGSKCSELVYFLKKKSMFFVIYSYHSLQLQVLLVIICAYVMNFLETAWQILNLLYMLDLNHKSECIIK